MTVSDHKRMRAMDYVLELIDAAERAEYEADLDRDPELRRAHAEASEELAGVLTTVAPVAPSDASRARLMSALDDKGPFASLVATLARLTDMAEAEMRNLVNTLDDAAAWMMGPADCVQVVHIPSGPATAGAICGFVKVSKGDAFPLHKHLGPETILVMRGEIVEEIEGGATVRYRVGDTLQSDQSVVHVTRSGPDEDLIYMVLVFNGIELVEDEDFIGPDDPRI